MTDALETASAPGLSLRPLRPDEPSIAGVPDPLRSHGADFDRMMSAWLSLTYVLNSLNRGLGCADNYPFVLSPSVVEKLRFVHHAIQEASPPSAGRSAPAATPAQRAATDVSA